MKTLVPGNPVHFPCYLKVKVGTVVIEIFLYRAPVLHDAAAFFANYNFSFKAVTQRAEKIHWKRSILLI